MGVRGSLFELNLPYLRLLTLSPSCSPSSPRTSLSGADGTRRERTVLFLSLALPLSITPFSLLFDEGIGRQGGNGGARRTATNLRTALSQQREEISMSRRGRAASGTLRAQVCSPFLHFTRAHSRQFHPLFSR